MQTNLHVSQTKQQDCNSTKANHAVYETKLEVKKQYAGYEVLTAVLINNPIVWYMTPCSPLKFKRRICGTCHLHLQDEPQVKEEISMKHAAAHCAVLLRRKQNFYKSLNFLHWNYFPLISLPSSYSFLLICKGKKGDFACFSFKNSFIALIIIVQKSQLII